MAKSESASIFKRLPHVGFALKGFSPKEQKVLLEVVEGAKSLAIPCVVEADFSPEKLKPCDVVLVAPKYAHKALKEGMIPISELQEGCENYEAVQEQGNGFFYAHPNKWEMFATVIRMLETFQFPYDWGNLKRAVQKEAAPRP